MTKKINIIRDSREKPSNGWFFNDEQFTTTIGTLKTADYTVEGLEDQFVIERKASPAEFAVNIFEARFERELERLDAFESAYILLEFTFEDILSFPVNSGIPRNKWKYIKTTPRLFLRKLQDMIEAHPTIHFMLVGNKGAKVARKLMKEAHDGRK